MLCTYVDANAYGTYVDANAYGTYGRAHTSIHRWDLWIDMWGHLSLDSKPNTSSAKVVSCL